MPFERVTRRGLAATALLVIVLVGPAPASAASPENRAAAKQHLSQAQAAKKQGKLAEACQHLEQVERLDPKLPTLIELAECTEQLGNVVEAEAWWAMARDRAKHDEKPQSRARAEGRLAAMQKRVAHLTLQLAAGAPPGIQVLRDDVPLDAASLGSAQPTNPGDHVVVVKLAGHDDARYAVKLAYGDNQTLPIAPGPPSNAQSVAPPPPSALPSPAAPPSSPPPAVTPPTAPDAPVATGWWSGPRTAGVILGSAGIVAVGAGSALLVARRHADGVDGRVAAGAISAVCGGVLLVSGVALLAGGSGETTQQARMRLTPALLIGPGTTVLGAAGSF